MKGVGLVTREVTSLMFQGVSLDDMLKTCKRRNGLVRVLSYGA